MNVQQLSETLEQAERERAEKLRLMSEEMGKALRPTAEALFAGAREFGEALRPLAAKVARLEAELQRRG